MPSIIDQLAHHGQRVMLTLGDYQQIWREQGVTSLPDLPRDPSFQCFSCLAASFAVGEVYPVWWIDPDVEKFVSHCHHNRRPITFEKLMHNKRLCCEMLARRQLLTRGERPHHIVICEHSQSQRVTVVKDGCKELLACLWQGKGWEPLTVVQVSGKDWSNSWLDMGFILHWRQEQTVRKQAKLKDSLS
ncbi:MAG: hypothetical protein NT163_05175 [Chlorobiales bacterium]|nr:hypothetical protein [Chlorobiales bacterium]